MECGVEEKRQDVTQTMDMWKVNVAVCKRQGGNRRGAKELRVEGEEENYRLLPEVHKCKEEQCTIYTMVQPKNHIHS